MVHVVNKGKDGEREVVSLLNLVFYRASEHARNVDGITCTELMKLAQRNQNQSSVGGGDINLLGLSFEVKRQEDLDVNAWWRQCLASAERNGDHPVLIYRQSRRPWHVVTWGHLSLPSGRQVQTRVTFDQESFERWFLEWVLHKMETGEITAQRV